MKLYLNHELFERSPGLLGLLNGLAEKGYITVESNEDSLVSVSFVIPNRKQDSQLILNSVLLENCRFKLLDDLFQNYIKTGTEDKYFQALKDLYDGFITSTMLNQKYYTEVSFTSFIKNAEEKNKDGQKFCDIFDAYIHQKKEKLIKQASNIKLVKENASTADIVNRINEIKERKKILKAEILSEQIKNEQAFDDGTKRLNLVQKSFNLIVDIKCTQENDNDNVDLIYQEHIFRNLKFYREFIEKKVMSEIYTKDQVGAFRIIKDLLEKKLLFAENDRNYIIEKLEKQKKNPDFRLASIISEITEVNRITKKKERELHRLKNPQN